jgi:hypothetical protein
MNSSVVKSASNLMPKMFSKDDALGALRAQKLHLKLASLSADYDYPS